MPPSILENREPGHGLDGSWLSRPLHGGGVAWATPSAEPGDVFYGAEPDVVRWHGPASHHLAVSGPEPGRYGASYGALGHIRPDIAALAEFADRVQFAAFHFWVVFEQGGRHDVVWPAKVHASAGKRGAAVWSDTLAEAAFDRFCVVRRALYEIGTWDMPSELARPAYAAFDSLCGLTPAVGHQLKLLYPRHRADAVDGLVRHLDKVADILKDALALSSRAEAAISEDADGEAARRLEANQLEILLHAGQPLGLSEAAERLGTTRQAVHKRISVGSVLGVMMGRKVVVPAIQFVAAGKHLKPAPDLRRVIKLFDRAQAGRWAALQFLIEPDPLLGAAPIEVLKAGTGSERVEQAARGHLGLDVP